MVGHLLYRIWILGKMEANFGGECSLSVSLSLCLSLSLVSLSLAQQSATREANEQQEQQEQQQQRQQSPRERKSYDKSLFFLTSVCFRTFSEIPQKETRAALFHHHRPSASFLIFFFSSSSYPPFLKEESVSEACSSLRARTASFYQKFRKHLRKQRTKGC